MANHSVTSSRMRKNTAKKSEDDTPAETHKMEKKGREKEKEKEIR